MQCCAAVRAAYRKLQTPQLWMERRGGGWTLLFYVVSLFECNVSTILSPIAVLSSMLKSLLVFTKSVDNDFRAFWLAPVTRTIIGYSLFWDGNQNGFSFPDSFERWTFSGKWSSCTNKYQERDKIWLVGVSVDGKKFPYWICNKIIKLISETLSIAT